MASVLKDLEWYMFRQTKLSLALNKTEKVLNVRGGIKGRSHVGYAKSGRVGIKFSHLRIDA